MIDIFIKSFNRPYYLDRCLYSIFQFVSGEYFINNRTELKIRVKYESKSFNNYDLL